LVVDRATVGIPLAITRGRSVFDDDKQPRHIRIKPAFGEIVDRRLHHGGILSRAFDHVAPSAERRSGWRAVFLGLDIPAVQIDCIDIAEHLVLVAAIGIAGALALALARHIALPRTASKPTS
jgi:hypothetical protein